MLDKVVSQSTLKWKQSIGVSGQYICGDCTSFCFPRVFNQTDSFKMSRLNHERRMCCVYHLALLGEALSDEPKEVRLRLCVKADRRLIKKNNDWRVSVFKL